MQRGSICPEWSHISYRWPVQSTHYTVGYATAGTVLTSSTQRWKLLSGRWLIDHRLGTRIMFLPKRICCGKLMQLLV